jgi:hypothetical protein
MSEPRSLDIPEAALAELYSLEEVVRSAEFKPLLDYEICVEESVIDRVTPFVKSLPLPTDVFALPELLSCYLIYTVVQVSN